MVRIEKKKVSFCKYIPNWWLIGKREKKSFWARFWMNERNRIFFLGYSFVYCFLNHKLRFEFFFNIFTQSLSHPTYFCFLRKSFCFVAFKKTKETEFSKCFSCRTGKEHLFIIFLFGWRIRKKSIFQFKITTTTTKTFQRIH